jgi:hypothetical protein
VEPVDGAPCFFTGSTALGGCGLPSTDSLSGFVSAGNGKIQGGRRSEAPHRPRGPRHVGATSGRKQETGQMPAP